MILTERAARLEAEARAAEAIAARRLLDLEIERMKLQLLRWNRERFGRDAFATPHESYADLQADWKSPGRAIAIGTQEDREHGSISRDRP
jgi:hypothetical protein